MSSASLAAPAEWSACRWVSTICATRWPALRRNGADALQVRLRRPGPDRPRSPRLSPGRRSARCWCRPASSGTGSARARTAPGWCPIRRCCARGAQRFSRHGERLVLGNPPVPAPSARPRRPELDFGNDRRDLARPCQRCLDVTAGGQLRQRDRGRREKQDLAAVARRERFARRDPGHLGSPRRRRPWSAGRPAAQRRRTGCRTGAARQPGVIHRDHGRAGRPAAPACGARAARPARSTGRAARGGQPPSRRWSCRPPPESADSPGQQDAGFLERLPDGGADQRPGQRRRRVEDPAPLGGVWPGPGDLLVGVPGVDRSARENVRARRERHRRLAAQHVDLKAGRRLPQQHDGRGVARHRRRPARLPGSARAASAELAADPDRGSLRPVFCRHVLLPVRARDAAASL